MYIYNFFSQNKLDDYLYLYVRNLQNSRLKLFFLVHNNHLYLCQQVENTKWILCSRKMVLIQLFIFSQRCHQNCRRWIQNYPQWKLYIFRSFFLSIYLLINLSKYISIYLPPMETVHFQVIFLDYHILGCIFFDNGIKDYINLWQKFSIQLLIGV